jgi:hypothetical protein
LAFAESFVQALVAQAHGDDELGRRRPSFGLGIVEKSAVGVFEPEGEDGHEVWMADTFDELNGAELFTAVLADCDR